MSVGDVQARGIRFLLVHRNPDGGVPCVDVGAVSGCWTTAEAIEALLSSPYLPYSAVPSVRAMTEFLLDSQLRDGSWPIVKPSAVSSTMATGHSVAALTLSGRAFLDDKVFYDRIESATRQGLAWLDGAQAPDHGWGPEPATEVGRKSRTLATCYAMRGYIAAGHTYDNSLRLREAVTHLLKGRDPNSGGWSSGPPAKPDPASTGRVISTLLQTGHITAADKVTRSAIKYLLTHRAAWRYTTESYVAPSAPGQGYHGNTPAEALEALIRCQNFGTESRRLLDFFLQTQDEVDGHWHLRDLETVEDSISTWSSSEAIIVIDLAYPAITADLYRQSRARRRPVTVGILLFACLLEAAYIVNLHGRLGAIWSSVPPSRQQFIEFGVILVVVLGVASNFLTDWLRHSLSPVLKRLRNSRDAKRDRS